MSRAAILIGVGEVHGQRSSETVEYNLARIYYTWNSCQQIQGKFAINPFFCNTAQRRRLASVGFAFIINEKRCIPVLRRG